MKREKRSTQSFMSCYIYILASEGVKGVRGKNTSRPRGTSLGYSLPYDAQIFPAQYCTVTVHLSGRRQPPLKIVIQKTAERPHDAYQSGERYTLITTHCDQVISFSRLDFAA